MEFKTPIKLIYDQKERGTIFVHWKLIVVADDSGISRLRPEIDQIIDLPITNYNIRIKIKSHQYIAETAFFLLSPAHYNSIKQILTLEFDTEPSW